MKFSADDNHFIKVALFCCFQGCFDVKVRQFLRVDTRVSIEVRGCAGGGKEFCWPITWRSALRQWCEINNLLRAASTRGGGSLHAYGFQSDLRQHVRLGSNGVEFMVFCVYEFFVLCWQSMKFGAFMWMGRVCAKITFLKTTIWHRKCVFRAGLLLCASWFSSIALAAQMIQLLGN